MRIEYLALEDEKWSLRGALATWQSQGIASLRPVHHAVQGFARNDNCFAMQTL